ncbi:MAG: serine/threonine-protein kinase PknK [Deltaproteobacteria bacterium HGW-Deltaproteobacteria-13]|jgi:diguanylate cyclase (GGDEF)-like protein|nr:MAG: serine/threonine-protein kinase PknK [Deltaproteobacteria bacterium HGW-Deltaproteobacteria-13]
MMEKFADYILQEMIHETRNSVIYRGHKENESRPLIIKLLKTMYPTPAEIARFKQEYELVKKLDIENIIKIFDLVEYNDKYAIIEEDFGGISLREILKTNKLELKSFLQIASKVSETLGLIHKNNIMHLDIKPDNILINEKQNNIKISDFGISALLTHANDELYNPDVIEGTLSYMSPEQTGRMNRGVDYRTDMYSLGATFYEMLTGDVPFKSTDPMELIHSHIARQPSAPRDVNSSIPRVLSAMVMKLLAKNPEERYQNCFGLMTDIDRCLNQLNQTGRIDEFPIATKDISIRFNIPRSLVDRDNERIELMKGFERTSRGLSEIILVTGQPGIGKSALINEIYKPIIAKKGYFIFGKFDQFRKDVPYSAIIQSFQGLIRQIITESGDKVQSWREKLLLALGSNGKVITDVIPELELIISKQPEVPLLGPEESINRFNMVFQNFLNIITSEEHPLVLFLDDLQWADQASLKLMENLMTTYETKYFLLIGAYRDNETNDAHPLTLALNKIRQKGRKINYITLGPLDVNSINLIIMNVLICPAEKSLSLAELISKKTAGNPFFVIQFLKNIYDNHLLELNAETGWEWDINKIREMKVTENVIEFMAEKISHFPKKTQEILKICACIGNRFDLESLSVVAGKSIEETLADLNSAVQEDMISIHGNIYKFLHDRIQEAAYSMIPEDEKEAMHYRIGRNVLNKTGSENLNEKIFYIVDQLNRGIRLVAEADERIRLATLNLQAAQKAKKSTAYASASYYLKTAIGLLPGDCWTNHYELTYPIYREAIECEYLNLNFSEAEKLFEIVVNNAKTNIDKANVHTLMIVLYTTQGNYEAALKVGLEGMKMVGFKTPSTPGNVRLGWELLKLRLKFGRRKIEDLADIHYIPEPKNLIHMQELAAEYMRLHPSKSLENPALELWEKLSYAYLAIHTGTVAFYYNPNLFAYIVISGVNYLLDFDITFEYSPFAYIAMGSIVGSSLGFYQHGYRFGVTALKINEKIADTKNRCRVEFSFPMFIQHWKKHARYDLDYFRNAYKNGIENGDLIFSGHSVNLIGMTRIMMGDNLDQILEEYGKYKDFQLEGKDPFIARNYTENTRMCLCLIGLTEKRGSLNGDGFDEEEQANYYQAENNLLGTFYFSLVRLRINYLFGEFSKCRDLVPDMQRIVGKKTALGNLHIPEFYFYHSLTLTASYADAGFLKRRSYKMRLRLNQMKMLIWAKSCPENFKHKYDLVAAELMKIKGRFREAQRFYHVAIEGARKNGYLQEEAIACERLALFYLDSSCQDEAGFFMQKAHRCYFLWGALAKVNELEEKYASLIPREQKQQANETITMRGSTITMTMNGVTETTSSTRMLDLSTAMRVSQIISSEIVLDRLLQKIMHESITSAGAQRGYLILESGGELTIEASEDMDKNEGQVMQSMPLKDCDEICRSVVNYVYHSGEDIVLGNASKEGLFTSDPYIMRVQCKSILCTPIMSKGKLSGILYMENNLSENSFTPERLEILRSFSVQAAISIENARLFELATTDGMTKLYVHRYFQLLLDQEIYRSQRHNKTFSLIMMDIDNFKSFNDTYGHQLGDKVLKDVAAAARKISRAEDITARYGGEEFVMILPETDSRQAMILAERIRESVAEIEVLHENQALHVTISLGVSTYPDHAEEKEELIHAADAALYASKRSGKNRASLFEKNGMS